jgi:long-chain fatty acid transport protein
MSSSCSRRFRTRSLSRATTRLVGAWLVSLCVCEVARGDGFLRDGLGPIPAARGATNVAHADNGGVLLDNPAALANVEPAALVDLHLGQYLFAFRYVDPENSGAKGSGTLLPIADLALLVRPTGDDRLGYGFGVFVPAGFGADYDLGTDAAFGPGRHRYHSFAAFVKLVGGAAWRLTDRLSVGAHVGVAGAYVSLRVPYWVQTGALAGTPVRASVHGVGFAPAWGAGVQWTVTPGTVVGASYSAPNHFTTGVGGEARIALGSARETYDAAIELGLPRAVAAGLRHDASSWARLSADVTWRDWSSAFDRVGFDLTRGRGALGVPTVKDRLDLAWRDTWTVGVGCELFPTRQPAVLRIGYTHHPSPAPDATLTPVIPVTLEHVVAAGLGWRFGPTELDMSYQYTFGPMRRVERSNLVGGDFADSGLQVGGHAWFVGLTHRWTP